MAYDQELRFWYGLSDPELFTILRRSEADAAGKACAELYRRYFNPLRVRATRKLSSPDDGRDVATDVFVNLLRYRHLLLKTEQASPQDGDVAVKAYLYQMLDNGVIKVYARRKRQVKTVLDSEQECVE